MSDPTLRKLGSNTDLRASSALARVDDLLEACLLSGAATAARSDYQFTSTALERFGFQAKKPWTRSEVSP
jgi:hypothetical protein